MQAKRGKRSNLLNAMIIRQNPLWPVDAQTAFSKPFALSACLPSGDASLATGCIFFFINLPVHQTPVSQVSFM